MLRSIRSNRPPIKTVAEVKLKLLVFSDRTSRQSRKKGLDNMWKQLQQGLIELVRFLALHLCSCSQLPQSSFNWCLIFAISLSTVGHER